MKALIACVGVRCMDGGACDVCRAYSLHHGDDKVLHV